MHLKANNYTVHVFIGSISLKISTAVSQLLALFAQVLTMGQTTVEIVIKRVWPV
jgi:acyl-CoA hydrolase